MHALAQQSLNHFCRKIKILVHSVKITAEVKPDYLTHLQDKLLSWVFRQPLRASMEVLSLRSL